MRVAVVAGVLGAVLCLRCASFGTDPTAPAANDAGSSSSSSSSSGASDAASPSGIETRDPDGAICNPTARAVFGMDHDIGETEDVDAISPMKIDAYSYLVVTDEFAQCAHFYAKDPVDKRNGVRLGIYSNDPKGPHPLELLSEASFSNVISGWNIAPLSKAIRAPLMTRLWIGLAPTVYTIGVITDTGAKCNTDSGGMNPMSVGSDAKPPARWDLDPVNIEPQRCNARFFASP